MSCPDGRQGAVEEGIGAAPGRELGTSAGRQSGKDRDAHRVPGAHYDRSLLFILPQGCFTPLESDCSDIPAGAVEGMVTERQEYLEHFYAHIWP